MKMKYLILLIVLAGCSPYSRIIKRNPLTTSDSLNLSKRCLLTYPIISITVVRTDTVTEIDFERAYAAENELMNTLYLLAECKDSKGGKLNLDSIKNEIRKGIKPPGTRVITNTVTEIKKDSAEATALRIQLSNVLTELYKRDAKIEAREIEISDVKKSRNKYKWIVWGACIAGVGFLFFKLKSIFL